MEAYGAAGSIAQEVLSSIRTVVAFDGQKKGITCYERYLQSAKGIILQKKLFSGISNGFMCFFFVFASYALSFWYGVGLILDETYLPEEEITYTPANMVAVCLTFIQEILSLITFIYAPLLYFNCYVELWNRRSIF
jgi:ATP-binding cassette subfamily B (MDR/TAP) protein 1